MTDPDDDALFQSRLDEVACDVSALLERLLSPVPTEGEIARPARLLAAMRHASLEGGKRLRPFLVIETARLFDVAPEHALMTGAALECVHCYSLIHDDLPAMDDDTVRRGRPTVHKAFDEATAILAGDSLLTLAFEILSRPATHPDPATRNMLISALARAAGLGGMAGGQMLDLAAEGRFDGPRTLEEPEILMLQRMKTGALFQFACSAGAMLGGADPVQRDSLARYGAAVGQAFQIGDDLLDLEGDPATLGKDAHKGTLVNALGREGARARLGELVREAESALVVFGVGATMLKAAARFIATRHA
jgi:farnesyl diphosphate synthase